MTEFLRFVRFGAISDDGAQGLESAFHLMNTGFLSHLRAETRNTPVARENKNLSRLR